MSRVNVSSGNAKRIKPFIISAVFGSAVTIILLLIFALIISKIDAPLGIIGVLSSVALGIGCIAAGITIGKIFRKNGLFLGGFIGIVIFAICFLVSLIIGDGYSAFAVIKLIISICAGAIGGVAGVNSKSKRY